MAGLSIHPPEPAFPSLQRGWAYRLSHVLDDASLRGARCTFDRWVWVGPCAGWRARVTLENGDQRDMAMGCVIPL